MRKRRGWSAYLWPVLRVAVLAIVLAYACYRAAMVVMHAPMFEVEHVVIKGNERLSTGEILTVLDGLRGASILRTDLRLWRQRLLTSPWVRDAALRRVLPGTVEVVVSERMPVGIGRLGTRLYLIDAEGVVIDEYGAQYTEFDLPVIDGLSAGEAGSAIDERRAALAARLLDAIAAGKGLSKRISQIDVRDPHDAVVILDGDPALVHLGEEDFLERLRSYVELAPVLRKRVPQIDYVDLRFGDRVYVRPAAREARPRARPARRGAAPPRSRF